MKYIVLDLEWNCPINQKIIVRNENTVLNAEIIQIGAVMLDESFHEVSDISIYIKPKFYRTLSKKVSKLTGITDEGLRMGFSFENAVLRFKKWCGNDVVFLTWGNDDRAVLYENLSIYRLDTEWLPKAYDLQVLFDTQVTGDGKRHNLDSALEALNENGLPAHNALHDAKNTALVCSHLDIARGLAEYDEKKSAFFDCLDTCVVASEKLPGSYADRKAAYTSAQRHIFKCPSCGSELRCSEFIYTNLKQIAIAECENGEEYYIRLKSAENSDGTYFINVTYLELTEAFRENYIRKREKYHERMRKAALLAVSTDSAES